MKKCLETRRTPEGFKRRRYQRDDGTRYTTVEVPVELWTQMNGQGRGANRLAAIRREQERDAVRAQGRALLDQGWKPDAVACELGLSVRTAQRLRQKGKQ